MMNQSGPNTFCLFLRQSPDGQKQDQKLIVHSSGGSETIPVFAVDFNFTLIQLDPSTVSFPKMSNTQVSYRLQSPHQPHSGTNPSFVIHGLILGCEPAFFSSGSKTPGDHTIQTCESGLRARIATKWITCGGETQLFLHRE